jgi:hypothetical protein
MLENTFRNVRRCTRPCSDTDTAQPAPADDGTAAAVLRKQPLATGTAVENWQTVGANSLAAGTAAGITAERRTAQEAAANILPNL